MRARDLGFAIALAGLLPAYAAAADDLPWLQAAPADPAEAALREALSGSASGGPVATAAALRRVSAAHPGSGASGLAQLAAGLLLLEARRPAEALPSLLHPDIALTRLTDCALLALAQARETTGDAAGAAQSYGAAADARPEGPLACTALLSAGESFVQARKPDKAVEVLGRALAGCPGQEPRALLQLAEAHKARRDPRRAAEAYDRLDRDYPASPEAREGSKRLRALAAYVPPSSPEAASTRALKKALAFSGAGRHREAVGLFRQLQRHKLSPEEVDFVRVRLARGLMALGSQREARAQLVAVGAGSAFEDEAGFLLAKMEARRQRRMEPYEAFASRFPGSPWAEEALITLASSFQKDARGEQALPYYRRLLHEHPDGRYVERATWRVAWSDYREGRFEAAASALERAARVRSSGWATAGFLYWAARARRELGQSERARQLLEETVRRFKHTYHGIRAREILAQLPPGTATPPPVLRPAAPDPAREIAEPQLTRVRQLLLIDRLDEAFEELRGLASSPAVEATIAWIEYRRGRLRPAIIAMKRAFPEYVGEAGDLLPEAVWRILYPLEFADMLQEKAIKEGLDPALVASLICQESTFDAGAVSRAGARGLMQVIPPTGRRLAQDLGIRYQRKALHDPEVSLHFGTRYLRQMLERFGGRIERALAAYNAGPHRVEAWTASRPDMSAEEFIESIPFTETRHYVMTVLAGQHLYRRIYALPAATAATSGGGSRE